MHPITLIREIHRLLQQGELSQSKIAERMCVSRGTISAIASGSRGLHGRESTGEYATLVPTSPPVRCPECGYRIYLPCVICQIRQHRHRQRLAQQLAAQQSKESASRRSQEHGSEMKTTTWRRAIRQNQLSPRTHYFRAS